MKPVTLRIYRRRGFAFSQDVLMVDRKAFVGWLATCILVFEDPTGKLCVLYVNINDMVHGFIRFYAHSHYGELSVLYRRIEPSLMTSRRVVLSGYSNVKLDPDLDRMEGEPVLITKI